MTNSPSVGQSPQQQSHPLHVTVNIPGRDEGTKSRWVLLALALTTCILFTNTYPSLSRDADLISGVATDSYNYLAIAEAAPRWPSKPFGFHHAQRMVVPFALGLIYKATAVPLYEEFRILVVLLMFGIVI